MKKCIPILVLLCLLCGLCLTASAAMVTDTLTVKVGYWGMETDSYVEIGTYHWSELEDNLPLHRQAYSFFRPDAEGEYRIAIDSACGFYLTDLLSYANIYQDDVLSLQFYTKDQEIGFFTSFTTHELFETRRYYFEDLAAHIHPVETADGEEPAWDDSEAWAHCRLVPAMLALEDNWVWYDVGTEHTAPNYETMGTGNRFRLLFGQASPLETRTNQTAKYTHTVYVTLKGSPELGETPELDASIGSHTVSITMTVGNENILEVLTELLQISSSDENVLQITGVTVTPDAEYSDLVHVEIAYEVLTEGEAKITFFLGSETIGSPITLPAQDGKTEETPSESEAEQAPEEAPAESDGQPGEPLEPDNGSPSPEGEKPGEPDGAQTQQPSQQTQPQTQQPSQQQPSQQQPTQQQPSQQTQPQTQQPSQQTQTPTTQPAASATEAPAEPPTERAAETPTEAAAEAPEEPPDEAVELAAPPTEAPVFQPENEQTPTANQRKVILLDAATASRLRRLHEPPMEQVIPELPETASRQVVQLKLQEQKDAETLRWTAIGALLLLILGGASSLLYFKREK